MQSGYCGRHELRLLLKKVKHGRGRGATVWHRRSGTQFEDSTTTLTMHRPKMIRQRNNSQSLKKCVKYCGGWGAKKWESNRILHIKREGPINGWSDMRGRMRTPFDCKMSAVETHWINRFVQSNHPQPFTQYNPEISQLVEKSVSCCFLLYFSAPETAFIISPFYHLKMRRIDLSPTSTKFLEILPTSSFPETCRCSENSRQFWKALQRMDVGNWANELGG